MNEDVKLLILLKTLEKSKAELIALQPGDVPVGIKPKRRLTTESGETIFVYVPRQEVIEYIKRKCKFIKKGSSIVH